MSTQNFQVLIVDDNEINRDMLARRLHRRDFQITMAVNGREALDLVRQSPYDLILLDIMMPEVDGYTVLKFLKEDPRLKNISVIMISAIEEMDSVMKCMEIGADDYLTKPFDPDMLKVAVNRCISSKLHSGNPPTSPPIAPPTMPPITRITNPPTNPPTNIRSNPPSNPPIMPLPLPRVDTAIAGGSSPTSMFSLPDETTKGTSTDILTIDEIVLRIMQSKTINRKAYLYFSKAIFNTLFENAGLNEQEVYQIHAVFEAIQAGKVKVVV